MLNEIIETLGRGYVVGFEHVTFSGHLPRALAVRVAWGDMCHEQRMPDLLLRAIRDEFQAEEIARVVASGREWLDRSIADCCLDSDSSPDGSDKPF